MRDVILLDKVRGLKVAPGEYIEYNPNTNSYTYSNEQVIEGDGYFKKSTVSYDLSPEYMEELAKRGIVEYMGEDVEAPSEQYLIERTDIDIIKKLLKLKIQEALY